MEDMLEVARGLARNKGACVRTICTPTERMTTGRPSSNRCSLLWNTHCSSVTYLPRTPLYCLYSRLMKTENPSQRNVLWFIESVCSLSSNITHIPSLGPGPGGFNVIHSVVATIGVPRIELGQMVADVSSTPVASWIKQSVRVLKNATAQLATTFGSLEVLKELHDPIEVEFMYWKVFFAAAAAHTFATPAAAVE